MIYEVEGDILLSRAQAIAHGVAPNDPMHQGLALSLHERFPSMHKDYHHWCHNQHPRPGAIWAWSGSRGADGTSLTVINLLTQDGGYDGDRPGKANESNIRHSLKELRKLLEAENIASVALPRLATGVGGMDWTVVRPMLETYLGDLTIPVYLYVTYHAGQQAPEPGA